MTFQITAQKVVISPSTVTDDVTMEAVKQSIGSLVDKKEQKIVFPKQFHQFLPPSNIPNKLCLVKNNHPIKQIPMRPDHGHTILHDQFNSVIPGYSLLGRMKGLDQLKGVIKAIN